MENIVIGIEGDVASGKTTICKELINIVPNSIFIDAGSIYRGIMQALKQCKSLELREGCEIQRCYCIFLSKL